jgi:hypothetical protein
MVALTPIIVLLSTILELTSADYLGLNPQGIPIYTIDLDLPPRERFKETAIAFKEPYFTVEKLYLDLENTLGRAMVHGFASIFWEAHPDKWEEIKGMAEAINGR